jgi:hypothetical protein
MLWKYKKCYQEDSEDVIDPPPSTDLRITSSVPELGTGVINISGGQPNEDINLYNEFLDNVSTSTFGTTPLGACSPPLDSLHEFSTGIVTLDISGNLTYTYYIRNMTIVKITITGRSSAEPLPTTPNNFTIINNS